jgi:hypothetical protein
MQIPRSHRDIKCFYLFNGMSNLIKDFSSENMYYLLGEQKNDNLERAWTELAEA